MFADFFYFLLIYFLITKFLQSRIFYHEFFMDCFYYDLIMLSSLRNWHYLSTAIIIIGVVSSDSFSDKALAFSTDFKTNKVGVLFRICIIDELNAASHVVVEIFR